MFFGCVSVVPQVLLLVSKERALFARRPESLSELNTQQLPSFCRNIFLIIFSFTFKLSTHMPIK